MFDNKRYLTRGIDDLLDPGLVIFLWSLIDDLRASSDDLDYLQVFELKALSEPGNLPNQQVLHRTEVPEYEKMHVLSVEKPVTVKVYAIDSGEYSTMLLASEY